MDYWLDCCVFDQWLYYFVQLFGDCCFECYWLVVQGGIGDCLVLLYQCFGVELYVGVVQCGDDYQLFVFGYCFQFVWYVVVGYYVEYYVYIVVVGELFYFGDEILCVVVDCGGVQCFVGVVFVVVVGGGEYLVVQCVGDLDCGDVDVVGVVLYQ